MQSNPTARNLRFDRPTNWRRAGRAACLTLVFALLAIGPVNAGDSAERRAMGFSVDGRYFAFEQFGIQDGSGFPYADIFIVDDLGLRVLVQHSQLGLLPTDNIDSLDTIALVNNSVADTLDVVFTDPCPADVNNDGIVDLGDLSAVLFNFGATGNAGFSLADATGDGAVGLADLSEILFNFGLICPP